MSLVPFQINSLKDEVSAKEGALAAARGDKDAAVSRLQQDLSSVTAGMSKLSTDQAESLQRQAGGLQSQLAALQGDLQAARNELVLKDKEMRQIKDTLDGRLQVGGQGGAEGSGHLFGGGGGRVQQGARCPGRCPWGITWREWGAAVHNPSAAQRRVCCMQACLLLRQCWHAVRAYRQRTKCGFDLHRSPECPCANAWAWSLCHVSYMCAQESKQFLQLKQMMQAKSQEVVALRKRLERYEPHNVPTAD